MSTETTSSQAEALTPGQWTLVKERLPPVDMEVLVRLWPFQAETKGYWNGHQWEIQTHKPFGYQPTQWKRIPKEARLFDDTAITSPTAALPGDVERLGITIDTLTKRLNSVRQMAHDHQRNDGRKGVEIARQRLEIQALTLQRDEAVSALEFSQIQLKKSEDDREMFAARMQRAISQRDARWSERDKARAERDTLRKQLEAINNRTCVHHTDEERNRGCPVCGQKPAPSINSQPSTLNLPPAK